MTHLVSMTFTRHYTQRWVIGSISWHLWAAVLSSYFCRSGSIPDFCGSTEAVRLDFTLTIRAFSFSKLFLLTLSCLDTLLIHASAIWAWMMSSLLLCCLMLLWELAYPNDLNSQQKLLNFIQAETFFCLSVACFSYYSARVVSVLPQQHLFICSYLSINIHVCVQESLIRFLLNAPMNVESELKDQCGTLVLFLGFWPWFSRTLNYVCLFYDLTIKQYCFN